MPKPILNNFTVFITHPLWNLFQGCEQGQDESLYWTYIDLSSALGFAKQE